ncbi:MAG: LemA family protein [Salinibacter sp.]
MRSKGAITLAVLVLVLGGVGCGAASTYNSLVQSDEQVQQAWANVQAAYQRRADLIPNPMETVKGAADFERKTLTAVTEARAKAASIQVDAGILDNPQKLQQFQQAQLEGTENRITVARRDYNNAVRQYNTQVRSFPTVLLAGLMGSEQEASFGAEQGADQAPDVSFD